MGLLYELSDLRSFQAANDVVRSEGVLVNLRIWTTQRQREKLNCRRTAVTATTSPKSSISNNVWEAMHYSNIAEF